MHVSLLKRIITKKKQVDKNDAIKLDAHDNESGEYKIKAIFDSAVYIKKSTGHLPGLYYLVF